MYLWLSISSGYYEGVINVQQADVVVKYKITVYDNAGNHIVDNNAGQYYTYIVIPEFPSTLALLMFLTILSIVIFLKSSRKVQN